MLLTNMSQQVVLSFQIEKATKLPPTLESSEPVNKQKKHPFFSISSHAHFISNFLIFGKTSCPPHRKPTASRRSFTSSKICSLKSWHSFNLRCSLPHFFQQQQTYYLRVWGFHHWFHHQTVRLPTYENILSFWGVGGEAPSF